VAREPLTAMILPSKPCPCRGGAFSCTLSLDLGHPSPDVGKVATASTKAALTARPIAARQGADCLIDAVISPCPAAFRACKFPGLRRKSERLTPH
jgi:hypothetical protein